MKTAPPSANAIEIQPRRLRGHPENHQLGLRVNVNPLTVNAERAEHVVGAIDPVPLAAVTRLREHVRKFGTRPCFGIAVLIDVVDPCTGHDLPAIGYAAPPDHLAETGEISWCDADAARRAHGATAVDGDVGVALGAQRSPEIFTRDIGITLAAGAFINPAEHVGVGRDVMKQLAMLLPVGLLLRKKAAKIV